MQKSFLNRLRGWLMRLPISRLRHGAFLFLSILVIWVSVTSAQEKSGAPDHSAVSAAKKSPDSKKQALPEESAETGQQSGVEGKREDKDSPELLRKRDEWFYKQRSSVSGHIPAGGRFKAFQHMQRMMVAEGKLVRQSDGNYAAATPQAGSSVGGAWSSIGPTPTTGGFFSPVSGRVEAVAIDPSDSTGNTVLIGGAQGGIWRSTDGGATWTAVGDANPSLAMGSIAFAPSAPATVYAGTGEQALTGFDVYYGAGILKSTNGGQSWVPVCPPPFSGCTNPFIGPFSNGFFPGGGARISYLSVNPTNANLILAGVQVFTGTNLAGVYCSADGGLNWTDIFPGQMATFVGFATSNIAYAALGRGFGTSVNGTNPNGVYKSTNATTCAMTFSNTSPTISAGTSI